MGEALERALRDGYTRALLPNPSACVRDEPVAAPWAPPRLVVTFPVAHEPSGMPYNPMPPEVRAPLDLPESTGAALDASVMVSSTRRTGALTAFAWRSVDARGHYTTRVTAARALTGWRALTATRDALFLQDDCVEAERGAPCPGVLRVTASGVTPLPDTSPLSDLRLMVAGDDGSIAFLGAWRTASATAFSAAFGRTAPTVSVAVVVSRDGVVTARVFSREWAVGLGERDGAWGLITDRERGGGLRFHGPDGTAVPFGQWRPTHVRHCAGQAPGAARIHFDRNAFGGDGDGVARFGCSGDCAPIAQAEGFTLRQDPGHEPCVERVLGVHNEYREGADGSYDQRQSVCFLSRGRPAVFIDRGDSVATVRAAVIGGAAVETGY